MIEKYSKLASLLVFPPAFSHYSLLLPVKADIVSKQQFAHFPWVLNVKQPASLPPYVCVFLSPPSTIQQMIRHQDQHLFWLPVLFFLTCASRAHPFPLKRAGRGESEGERWRPVGGRRVDWWSIPTTQLVVSVKMASASHPFNLNYGEQAGARSNS